MTPSPWLRHYRVFHLLMALSLLAAGPAWGAPITIAADSADRGLLDSTVPPDDEGDSRVSPGNTAIPVGESSEDSSEIRLWIPFALTADERAAIANAASITLDISLSSQANVDSFNVDIYGIPNRTGLLPAVTDYQAGDDQPPLIDNAFTASSPEGYSSFDVTDFAQVEAARAGDSLIVFRLQLDPASLPNDDDLWNRYIVRTAENNAPPTLTVTPIPEPSSIALAALGSLMCLWRCRRMSRPAD